MVKKNPRTYRKEHDTQVLALWYGLVSLVGASQRVNLLAHEVDLIRNNLQE